MHTFVGIRDFALLYESSALARARVHKLRAGRGSTVYILASVNNQQSAVAAAMAAVTNCTCTHTN